MRGFKTTLVAVTLLVTGLLGSACSGEVVSSDPVTNSGANSARQYLATNQPNQPAGGSQQLPEGWMYGIVLTTHFEKHYPISDNTWSMSVQKGDGSTATFEGAGGADQLNTGIQAGDYVMFKNNGNGLVDETEVRVVTKAAVSVNK
jgi:hypothetical protein